MQLSKELSQSITIVKVFCMFGVVYIHASVLPYMVDCSPAMTYYQRFITRVLTAFAVPGFFMCSGFLYFLKFDSLDSFLQKSKSRLRSLFIPYIFWIAMTLFVSWFLQEPLGLSHLFGAGEMKLIHDFTWHDFIDSFWGVRDGAPYLSTMWFLRDLMVCVLITPQLFLLLKGHYGAYRLTCILLLGLAGVSWSHVAISSIFYFSLGAFVSIHNINIFAWLKKHIKMLMLTGLCLATVYSLVYTEDRNAQPLYYTILQTLTSIVFFANMLLLAMRLSETKKGCQLATLGIPSYFIYLAHEPYMGYGLQILLKVLPPHWSQTLIFIIPIIYPIVVIMFCLLAFKLLKRIAPKVMSFAVGGKI